MRAPGLHGTLLVVAFEFGFDDFETAQTLLILGERLGRFFAVNAVAAVVVLVVSS